MNKPNIYRILAKNMIQEAFEAERVLPHLEKDINKTYARGLSWSSIKDWNIWFAELVDSCIKFRQENCEEVNGSIITKNLYNIFYDQLRPHVVIKNFVMLDITVEEDDENEEETVNDQVNGETIYWFNYKTGDLQKIEITESLTGETWEIWPDMEDFTSEMLFIDRDQAEAEGIA